MNLEWLESFRVTAGQRSFLQASEQLHISQPALTKQIRRLEDYYGVQLFTRSSSGVELTAEGKVFLEKIEKILEDLKTIRAEMGVQAAERVIRFGSLPSVAAYELPTRIFEWGQQGISAVIASTGPSQKLRAELKAGDIDAAVMEPSGEDDPSWTVVMTYSQPFYCIYAVGHRLAQAKRLFVKDVTNQPLILHPEGCEIRKAIFQTYRERGLEPIVAHEAPFGESLAGFVSVGAGVAIVPKGVVDRFGKGKILAQPIEDFPPRSLTVVARSRTKAKLLKGIW